MKIIFACRIVPEPQEGPAENKDLEHEFEIEWGSLPLPRPNDHIDLDHLVNRWEEGAKKEWFLYRTWFIGVAQWVFDEKSNSYYVRIYMDSSFR